MGSTLIEYNVKVDVYAPWIDVKEAPKGLNCLTELPQQARYDAVIVAVAHDQFREARAAALRKLGKPRAVLYDVKGILPLNDTDGRLQKRSSLLEMRGIM